MSTVINTNIQSMNAANALKVNNRAMSQAMEQLATGKRVNSAADDAAGLALSEGMSAQVRSLNMAVRNANDAISLAQTAEGAMIEISNMLQRMRELAVQSANGALDNTQRGYLNKEFRALADQIKFTGENTEWNGMKILDNSNASGDGAGLFKVQIGSESGQTLDLQVDDIKATTVTALGAAVVINTRTTADTAIGTVDSALEAVNGARATLGATINRLTSSADNLTNIAQNLSESRSRVLDTDYATATAELARSMIIQQAGTAVLAQANQAPQVVLALLR